MFSSRRKVALAFMLQGSACWLLLSELRIFYSCGVRYILATSVQQTVSLTTVTAAASTDPDGWNSMLTAQVIVIRPRGSYIVLLSFPP